MSAALYTIIVMLVYLKFIFLKATPQQYCGEKSPLVAGFVEYPSSPIHHGNPVPVCGQVVDFPQFFALFSSLSGEAYRRGDSGQNKGGFDRGWG